MFKKKQAHKTKEQIIWEKEQEKLGKQRREFIDVQFLPMMDGLTENLEEAQFICESLKSAINQAFEMRKKEMKLAELKLKESLANVKNPKLVEKHVKILDLLADQSVDDSVKMLDGLFNEANRVLIDSLKTKKLSDFKNDNIPTSKEFKSTGFPAET